jgi:predicted dinucleotide-binding enzyme
MFIAGDSAQAKAVVRQLAHDLGFAECYDFGGNDRAPLLEQLALAWINLAIFQGNGRSMAFKVLKR